MNKYMVFVLASPGVVPEQEGEVPQAGTPGAAEGAAAAADFHDRWVKAQQQNEPENLSQKKRESTVPLADIHDR